MPPRDGSIGSACTDYELKQIKGINSAQWDEIVPVTALRPGYEETRLNFQKVRFLQLLKTNSIVPLLVIAQRKLVHLVKYLEI